MKSINACMQRVREHAEATSCHSSHQKIIYIHEWRKHQRGQFLKWRNDMYTAERQHFQFGRYVSWTTERTRNQRMEFSSRN